jgi:hypothetical protein
VSALADSSKGSSFTQRLSSLNREEMILTAQRRQYQKGDRLIMVLNSAWQLATSEEYSAAGTAFVRPHL